LRKKTVCARLTLQHRVNTQFTAPAGRYNVVSVHRAWPALVVLLCSAARGQAPAYSAAGIVNASNFTPGPFTANSVVTLFGSNLTLNFPGAPAPQGSQLVTSLGGASVYVEGIPAPLLYAGTNQINFLIPLELSTGVVQVCVVRQGVNGPQVDITLVSGAPALFPSPDGYALAADWNNANAVVTTQTPAHSLDTIIVYATGLGSAGIFATGEIPPVAAQINNLAFLTVYLNGTALDPSLIKYAGVTPGFAGLYQINLVLPDKLGADPEIRVAIGNQISPPGLKLAVR
jgi:uncharacterized protein (TIGR03437 family)